MIRTHLGRGLALGTLAIASSAAFALPIDTWEPLSTGTAIPSVVRQSGKNADQVWIGYSNGNVYLSTNGRVAAPTWSRMDSASDGHGGTVNEAPALPVTGIAPTYSNDEYAAFVSFAGGQQGYKFWKVMWGTGGLSWTNLTSRLPHTDIWSVSVNPKDSRFVYVVTSAGVAYSSNYGETFGEVQPANDPLLPPSGSAVSAIADNPRADQIVVGTSSGEVWVVMGAKVGTPSWTQINSGHWGSMPQKPVSSLTIDSRDASNKTFYASFGGRTDKAIWTTRTGGQFWAAIHNPNIPVYGNGVGTNVGDISTAPVPSGTTLYASTEYGSFRSDDDGTTWFANARWSGKNVVAEYKHSDNVVVGNQLYPNLRIRNMGSVPVQVKGLSLRYRYTREGSSPESYYLDYSPYTVNRSITASGSERVLSLTINSSATVAAGAVSGEIQGRVAKGDWSNFDQSNDFSYLQSALEWTLNPYIAVYQNGSQVWGAFAR